MTLVGNMVGLFDRLQPLTVQFGLEQYRPVVLEKSVLAGLTASTSFEVLTPTPRVNRVSTSLVGTTFSENVTISEEDRIIKYISRRYTYEDLTENVDYWLVDAVQSGGAWTGAKYRLISLQNSAAVSWDAIVRRLPNDYER